MGQVHFLQLDYLTSHASLSPIRRGFAPGFVNYKKGCTRLAAASDKVYQLLARGRWFSPGTPASSTTKTGRHDIAEILLKVVLNTKNQSNQSIFIFKYVGDSQSLFSKDIYSIFVCKNLNKICSTCSTSFFFYMYPVEHSQQQIFKGLLIRKRLVVSPPVTLFVPSHEFDQQILTFVFQLEV